MNRSYKVIWNQSLNCFMAVAEYAKSRGKSSSHVVSSTSTASAAVSSGARLLRLSSLTVALAATGMTLSSQVFAFTGDGGTAAGANAIAIGGDSSTARTGNQGNQSVAIGFDAKVQGDQSVGLGANVRATGNSSIAIGGDDLNSVAGTNNNTAAATTYKNLTGDNLIRNYDGQTGPNSQYYGTTTGSGAVAIGVQASALGDLSTSFGTRTQANGVASTALGVGATSSKDGSVALGAGSRTDGVASKVANATVNGVQFTGFVGNASFAGTAADAGRQVSVGSIGNERQIKNVAPGELSATSTDAINGSQIYAVSNKLIDNINAVKTTADAVANGTAGLVRQANNTAPITVGAATGGTTVNFANSTDSARTLIGIADGSIAANSKEAVNGGQLNTTNQNVTTNATNITGLQNQTFKIQANGDTASAVKSSDTVQFVNGNNVAITRNGNNVTIGTSATPTFTSVTSTGAVNAGSLNTGGALTVTGTSNLNGGANLNNNKITGLANGTAATDAATFGQLTTANTKTDALGTSTAANLGGDAAYNATTGAVSAPAYSLNNGTVTANTVGGALTNLDGRTTTNTTNIATNTADIAKGFNIKAGSSAVDNVKLGETVGFTNTDNNLVITNNGTDNTVNYNLAQNLNLGATGSLLTGNTRVNNAGITVTGGTNDTVLLSRNGLNNGNNVITNVANGVAATDAATFGQLSTTNTNVATNTSNIANVRAQANRGFNISADNSDLVNNETVDNVQLGETVDFTNTDGNLVATVSNNGINYDLAENIDLGVNGSVTTGNTVTNNAGVRIDDGTNITAVTATGTNVTDGTNTSNYGANGLTATDVDGNSTVVNQTGLSFTNDLGATTGPSITAAGIDAGDKVISNLGQGSIAAGSKDAVTGDQLNTTNTNVTNNTTAIGDINAGRSGIVRQDAGTGAITVGATTGGTSVNFANSTGGARTLSGVADGNIAANSTDAVNGGQVNTLVNTVTNQINATNVNVTDNTNRSTGNLAALGGGAAYDATNNIYTQPIYTLDDGSNTGTNVTANNVGDALKNLDGRTTTNTSNIANVQAQANRGFNISADNSDLVNNETVDNVQLGETVDFTNTDGNLVATVSNNGINYDLAENIDLGVNGSLKTGNTTTNNAGVRIDDGTNITAVTATGTNVTDGTNTANYGANGFLIRNEQTNTFSILQEGNFATFRVDENTGMSNGSAVTPDFVYVGNGQGNGSIVTNDGFGFSDQINGTVPNMLSSSPSIRRTGIDAGDTRITNVADGTELTDAATFGQVQNAANAVTNNAPVVYTQADGTQVYNTANGFNTAQDGTGTAVDNADIITSVRNANGSTTTATRLSNVANGTVDAGSKDAVNGDQLNTTNTNVTNNTTAIGDITAGRSGIVRQDAGTGAITVGAATGGTSVNFANSTGGARTLSGVADGNIAANSTDAVNGGQVNTLVNTVTNQINATNANVADNTNRSTGNLAALGGGAEYDAANNIYTAPSYELNNGDNNTDTTVFRNVGDALGNLDGRTTSNTAAINQGFNISADNSDLVNNETVDNVQLGETVDFSNTDGNLVATVSNNGINYDLAENIDLGVNGSVTTGNTVTNNAGVRIDDGTNITAVTATGTNVTDGTNTSNYGANGFVATDGNGNTGRYNAGSTVLTDDSGNTNASAAIGNAILDDSGNVNLSGAIGNALFDSAGNANVSGAEGSVVFDNAGNRTITSATGTNVTDGTNTSNYGANGLTATDVDGNSTVVNQTGLSFTNDLGAATGPSITAAGINAGNSTISNVADGVAANDVATFGQLQAANNAADIKTDALGNSTAANLGGGAMYTPATGTVSAPNYTLDDGSNTGTNVTANNVGDALNNLDGRTTSNTAAINQGFNISAAGGTADNVRLGETVDFTNTDGNLVVSSNGANGINYNLAENIDLGANGSVTTGNTTTNNAGITILNGPVDTVTLGRNGLNNGGNRVTNVANGIAADDAATFGQVTDVNNKVNTLGTSTAANLGGGATYTAATGTVSAPTYTLDNGANTGTTADFDNVGGALDNLNTRTKTNTSDIADLASGKTGLVRQDNGTSVITVGAATGGTAVDFTNSAGVNRQLTGVASAGDYTVAGNANNAVNAGDLNTAVGNIENSVTDKGLTFAGDRGVNVKRKLGETLTITGGEQDTAALANGNNIGVSTNATNDGLLVQLAKNIDLGVDGSVKTGNTVTNNTGLAITDGANITAVTAAGTNVTDGTNTSNYSANGLSINNGPSITATGIDSAGNKITNIADATNAGDAVNFGQLQAANGAAAAKMDALGNSTANNLGGGATYVSATGTVSAPNYTLDDGSNTGTNVTANNVGDALNNLDGRTTTNTSNIANVQAQANQGFNISAAGGTADNVQLGETVDFTNTDGNLVVSSNGANGINYNLAENIDLGVNGSVTTGNTTTNNAGVRIDDGTNITAVTATGTSVTDGVNSSNYGANGFTIVGGPSVTNAGINAGNKVITNLADGVAATDAATKGQVDAVSTGLTDLTAGAVKYDRNADNTINKNSVTFEGTPAVIGQDDDGNNVVVSGGTRLSNVANGINTADAVNKGQLDSSIAQNVTKVEVNDQNGNPVTVNITDQVVNRNIDNSNMDSLFLTYNVEGQGITDRLTIGETVQKMNTEGVKFAHTKAVSAKGDLGITNDSSAGGDNSTAIGVNAIIQEGADSTVALGHNTEASANATNSVVIGKDSQVTGQSSIAIGNGAQALGNQSISIGTGNIVNGNNSGAFGDPSIINGDNSYSVGNNNTINSNDTFVLGNNVTSTVGGSVVLGTGSAARTGAGVAGYGATGNAAITATTSTTGAVAVGDATNGIYRQVTGVAAGTADSDAVNVSQLKAVSDTLQSNNEALSNAAVQYDKNADGTVNKGSITLGGGAAGTTITNVKAGNISAGSTDAVNGSQLHNLGNGVAGIIGGDATLDASGNLTASNIGGTGKGNISDAIAAVNQGNAQANENIQANKDRLDAGLSFGADSGATISKPIGDTTALKFEGGNNITTTATSSGIKFDLNGNIDVDNITADKVTTGNTTVSNSGVTIKDGPSMTTAGINAGDKTITGVADGIEVNDAVNLGQLTALDNKLSNSVNELGYKINEVEDDANAGISAAMAMSSLPQAYIPGKSMVGGGIATYNGQSAVAIGVSKVSDNGRWVIKVNGTADTQGNAGGAVGAGFHF